VQTVKLVRPGLSSMSVTFVTEGKPGLSRLIVDLCLSNVSLIIQNFTQSNCVSNSKTS